MNNPNPFIPQGSLLEQQNKKRARVKVAVFTIFAANILVLSPLLVMQGCNNKTPATDATTSSGSGTDTTTASSSTTSNAPDTNVAPALTQTTTSAPPVMPSNTVVTPPPPPPVVPPTPTTSEYTVVKGDSFFLIAKNNHIKVKELEAANPGVVPTKLKAGQKLQLPASASGAGSSGGGSPMGVVDLSGGGEMTYVVKPKDTLTKIAKDNGVSVKTLRSANSLKTDAIKVGQKLKVPQKSAPAPSPTPEPAPVSQPTTPTLPASGAASGATPGR